ncbi:MAG: tetratricopeptide repeat protein [Planctomycetota bacterium]|nr:tetratricopeptide repeat protein [Planctomycetota bacterium]
MNALELSAKLNEVRRHLAASDSAAARAALAKLQKQHADHPAVNQLLCLTAVMRLEYPQALYYAQRAAGADPHSGELLTNLANCLTYCGKREEAIAAYRRALELTPGLRLARQGLAQALHEALRRDEAVALMRELLAEDPGNRDAARLLAEWTLEAALQHEAAALLRGAVARAPDDLKLHTALCSTLNYADGVDPREVLAAHEAFGAAQERAVGAAVPRAARPRAASEKLVVGILSGDLRLHSCASYLEPLMEHLDRNEFRLVAYYNEPDEDAVTARFKRLADLWRPIARLGDDEAAAQIVGDRVDILLECHGHTRGQRFGVLQRRPAPLQGTYLGYPNTTGLRAVDFRIVDSKTDPAPRADALAVERLIRLDPSFLCYRPPRESPDVSPLPALSSGAVTFGSFNATAKLTERMIRVWTEVVRAVPGSRLLLKHFGMKDPSVRRSLEERFARAGMPAGGVELAPPHEGRADHLGMYARVDIGLDPFPYHGTTTTCEAFHMGVPVVSLIGDVHAARVGLSLLDSVGLDHLAVDSEEGYVRAARSLAEDIPALAALRSSLRARLASSPLCDGKAFAARLGAAFRALHDQRLADQSARGGSSG